MRANLLVAATAAAAAADQDGLTLRVYDNTALAGEPIATSVVGGASIERAADTPFSAELSGTVTFPAPGVYNFSCAFEQSTLGWVWIDGHQVCGDGHAYTLVEGTYDNPLPITTTQRAGLTLPFRAHLYNDGAPTRICKIESVRPAGCYDDAAHGCGFTAGASSKSGNDWEVAALDCHQRGFALAGAEAGDGAEAWCGQALPDAKCKLLPNASACERGNCPGNHSQGCGDSWVLNVLSYNASCTDHPKQGSARLAVSWARDGSAAAPIPAAALAPALPAAEARRDALQRGLASGWGAWLHSSLLPVVLLPEGATATPRLCHAPSGECIDVAVPDGVQKGGPPVRVGLHAPDRSYVQFFFGPLGQVAANVSVEYSVAQGDDHALQWRLTPVGCGAALGGDCGDYEVRVGGRHAWFRAGNATASGAALELESAGLGSVTLHALGAGGASPSAPDELRLPLGAAGAAVGLSTDAADTLASVGAAVDAAAATERARLLKRFGARAETGTAIGGAAMWTQIFNPSENVAPLMPVSRVWDFSPSPANSDWTYAVFDWDNLFASLLMGLDGSPTAEAMAYSNLFQVMKSKSAAGFVPNYAAGGMRSEDRSEPPVGAKVTLELFKKYGKAWVVDVVWDDLMDWSDWFLRRRVLQPAGLVALGSFDEQGPVGHGDAGETMQDARYESGLDNSPMYDGDFFDASPHGTHLMQLYDVGMSSMFVQECYALAELAALTNRSAAGAEMQARGDAMAAKVAAQLWDGDAGTFSNRFPNGTFYPRISPTSFYAMQARAPTDAQAKAMATNWLMNASRFCVAPAGDFVGNDDSCYWGLPSISADDAAFPPLGYWRGYVWGPMAQLTHWSLQNYDHVPEVRAGRKAMCKQLEQLMLSQWREHRHICENYNPHKTADTSGGDCSGTKFYHWGALTGLIGMVEDGLW